MILLSNHYLHHFGNIHKLNKERDLRLNLNSKNLNKYKSKATKDINYIGNQMFSNKNFDHGSTGTLCRHFVLRRFLETVSLPKGMAFSQIRRSLHKRLPRRLKDNTAWIIASAPQPWGAPPFLKYLTSAEVN